MSWFPFLGGIVSTRETCKGQRTFFQAMPNTTKAEKKAVWKKAVAKKGDESQPSSAFISLPIYHLEKEEMSVQPKLFMQSSIMSAI